MARTYFKAQPTAAETQIDWAEVGKNFSDMLNEEARVREEKKAAIDEASRQYQQTLNDVEQGQSATANQWWLTASNEMQEQMLMQDRMLKSGALNPRDYTLMRQNLVDGTDGLIDVFGKFNAEFKERMDRFEKEESQDLEGFLMESLESFGNFQKTAVVVNPETGMLSVADVDDNGAIINDPNKIRSVTSLQSLIARRYDRYDLDGATTEFADSIGTFDTISRRYGSETAKGLIQKVTDPFVKEFSKEELMSLGMSEDDAIKYSAEMNVYRAGEDRFVEDIMSVWSNTSSILTNSMSFAPNGEEYTFTFNEERAENEILLKKDAQGQIFAEYTEEQRAAVSEAIRDSLRNKLDRTIDTTVVSDVAAESATDRAAGRGEEAQKDLVGVWSELYYKEGEQKQAALDALLSSQKAIDGGLIDIKVNDKQVEFVYTNPAKNRTIPIPDKPTQDDWIRVGVEIHGIADIDDATRAAGRFPQDAEFGGFTDEKGKTITFESRREGPKTEGDPIEQAARLTSTAVKDEFFFDQDDVDVQSSIQAIVAPLGFSVVNDSNTANSLKITNPETGASIRVFTNEDGAESAKQAEALRAFINGQLTKATAEAYVRGAGAGTAGELD